MKTPIRRCKGGLLGVCIDPLVTDNDDWQKPQSLDFGFWILDWLRLVLAKLVILKSFWLIPLERGGLKPVFLVKLKH
ncbi:hypothetical protein C7B64_01480 [Merismopedia glauca CCAP 1448/3]|uniref:Uncharacterized protein n=1 Tax=Merismopedia glauca CCAP 1448/3 TaxID=1296344 RepID=A0A2T1C9U6_9CYAN|nr:hypothetical protein C7B64_01480 [Merismopedia glauca CCAP 1448/3]